MLHASQDHSELDKPRQVPSHMNHNLENINANRQQELQAEKYDFLLFVALKPSG